MSELLTTFSNALATTVEQAGANVVRVEGRRRLPASGVIWSADGVIVTAHHVVQHDENITVGLPDGSTTTASLVGRDPTTDLAVLRSQAANLPTPAWAELDQVRVGHLVLALGRPGQTVQATLGIVSALSEQSWRTPMGGQLDRYLQTDVVMYPGFSGGPLVSVTGALVGLNSSAVVRGVSLTIPAPSIRHVVETLLTHGRVRRGYLGVSTQPVRLPAGLAQQLGQETGLLLVAVEPDSPAEQGGLVLGDTLVALANTPVRHHDDLLAQLSPERVGTTVLLQLVRGGQVIELNVPVGERL
jgi:S1-C subfamily serine protease